MNSLDNLEWIPTQAVQSEPIIETYFVETHELEGYSWTFTQVEYSSYETIWDKIHKDSLMQTLHHTVLSLVVI